MVIIFIISAFTVLFIGQTPTDGHTLQGRYKGRAVFRIQLENNIDPRWLFVCVLSSDRQIYLKSSFLSEATEFGHDYLQEVGFSHYRRSRSLPPSLPLSVPSALRTYSSLVHILLTISLPHNNIAISSELFAFYISGLLIPQKRVKHFFVFSKTRFFEKFYKLKVPPDALGRKALTWKGLFFFYTELG